MVSFKFVAPFTYYKASVLPMSVKQTNQLHNGKRNEEIPNQSYFVIQKNRICFHKICPRLVSVSYIVLISG